MRAAAAWLRRWLAALAVVASAAAAHAMPPASSRCPSAGGWRFLCEAQGAEDLVAVPGTRWLIASALNLGHPASFSLIDSVAKRTEPIAFAVMPNRTAECPGPPDPARMSTDGLALRPGRKGVHRLFAANHGDRRAIEMFRLDARQPHPSLAWEGCAIMPAGTLPNAVAALPDGGLLAVSFHDPNDADAWARMARGENTGKVLEWHAGIGFRTLADSAMAGGNGIALSPDGHTAYVSAWAGRRLIVLPLSGGHRREIPLPFLPDNLHLLADGALLVGGQRTSVAAIARCNGADCRQPWVVARVDPAQGAVRDIVSAEGSGYINYACGAYLAGHTVFMTVRGSGGIAYRDDPAALSRLRK